MIRVDDSHCVEFVEHQLVKIEEGVNTSQGQLGDFNSHSSEIDEYEYTHEMLHRTKQTYWRDLSDKSSVGTDITAANKTMPKATLHGNARPATVSGHTETSAHRYSKPCDTYE